MRRWIGCGRMGLCLGGRRSDCLYENCAEGSGKELAGGLI